MSTIFSSANTSVRRAFDSLGLSEGNETLEYPRWLHRRVENYVGSSRMKYVLFLFSFFLFLLYLLATHSIEQAYQKEYDVSPFHRNYFPASIGQYPVTTDNSTTINTARPTFAPTALELNGTIPHGGTTIKGNTSESDPTYTLFMSILLTMIGWMMMVQVLSCVRRSAISSNGTLQRRRELQEDQRRAIMEHFRMIHAIGRRQMTPAMMQQLRLAFVQRDFTGDDYELLMQLDEAQNANGNMANRRGAASDVISRLPTHRISQAEIDSMKSVASEGANTPAREQDEENKVSKNESVTAPQCHICLAPYEAGEEVRTLLCLHQFHRPCVDQWLRTNAVCPICKFNINGEMTDH